MSRNVRCCLAVAAALAGLFAAAPAPRAEEELVQCLLPSAARRLGPIAFLPPRRIVAVTAGNCARFEGEVIGEARALAIAEGQVPLRPGEASER